MTISQDTRERFAVSCLLGYCEGLAQSGVLTEQSEATLRHLIAQTLAAFKMPSKAERDLPPLDTPEDHLAYVRDRLKSVNVDSIGFEYSYDEMLAIIGMQMGATL
jgi:hypothetical protein